MLRVDTGVEEETDTENEGAHVEEEFGYQEGTRDEFEGQIEGEFGSG